jgi:hypothetical protein
VLLIALAHVTGDPHVHAGDALAVLGGVAVALAFGLAPHLWRRFARARGAA